MSDHKLILIVLSIYNFVVQVGSFSSFSAFLSKDMVGPEVDTNAPAKKGSTVKLTIFHLVEVLLKVTLNYINTYV